LFDAPQAVEPCRDARLPTPLVTESGAVTQGTVPPRPHPPAEGKLHATLHVIVEAQIALGDETPAGCTGQRLIGEGLDHHDAIVEHIYDVFDEFKQEPERTIFR